MSDNVIMPAGFARSMAEGDLDALKEAGIRVQEGDPLEGLELDDPKNGEITIGVLTNEEASIFAELYRTYQELDDLTRSIDGEILTAAAAAVKSGKDATHLPPDFAKDKVTDDDRKKLIRLRRRTEMLKTLYLWRVCERLDAHHLLVGVRSGGRVIRRIG